MMAPDPLYEIHRALGRIEGSLEKVEEGQQEAKAALAAAETKRDEIVREAHATKHAIANTAANMAGLVVRFEHHEAAVDGRLKRVETALKAAGPKLEWVKLLRERLMWVAAAVGAVLATAGDRIIDLAVTWMWPPR
jgi:hypothetical protein